MFGVIQLHNTVFLNHISALKSINSEFSSANTKFYDYKSNSVVLDLYKEHFSELSVLISSYSSFLEKDIELIRKSGEKIFNLDSDIGNKFNQSTDE